MRRALLLCLGLAAVTWLEFEFFPGHTYLQGDTQIYLPVLERLDAPGFLSRDLVATHPHVTYTIYDEVTLFLHEVIGLNFKVALTLQQILCRIAALLGVFLLALATGLDDAFAFLIAALLNLGATLLGPAVLLVECEPVPRAFAFGLVLLAMGLLARERPLLAGFAGGIALLYHPAIAAAFWVSVLLAFVFDRRLRPLLRPALTILLVFVLLLGNLAQLQPGVVESQSFWGKISARLADLQQYRTKYVWVSLWSGRYIWHYLAIFVCGLWATVRIWPALNRQTRWLFLMLPVCGILSIPISDLLLEHLRWSLIPQIQPARILLFTVAVASVACSIAGVRAALARKIWEACLWFVLVIALPIDIRVLDLLRVRQSADLARLGVCILLAVALAILLRQFGATKWRPLVLLIPVVSVFATPRVRRVEDYPKIDSTSIAEVADWAEENTWGSSMFLFPDAGRELYPGIFRAESRRALWVDWQSGTEVDFFESAANEWWDRWQHTMQGSFSPPRLQDMLSLPVDYYVLKRRDQLADIKPVFANGEFIVYDTSDLKNASTALRYLESPPR